MPMSTTPLDYTMNCFFQQDDPYDVIFDQNFTLAVLQQARNSTTPGSARQSRPEQPALRH